MNADGAPAPCYGSHGGRKSVRLGRQPNAIGLGCNEQLRLATWNCCGLSATQKQLCSEMQYDILGLTETHDKGVIGGSLEFISADPVAENDPAAGVALLLSTRVSKCVLHSGCIGSRIVFEWTDIENLAADRTVWTNHVNGL